VHERYRRQTDRRQTDGRATAYSEREREFTFAKNQSMAEVYRVYRGIQVPVRTMGIGDARVHILSHDLKPISITLSGRRQVRSWSQT